MVGWGTRDDLAVFQTCWLLLENKLFKKSLSMASLSSWCKHMSQDMDSAGTGDCWRTSHALPLGQSIFRNFKWCVTFTTFSDWCSSQKACEDRPLIEPCYWLEVMSQIDDLNTPGPISLFLYRIRKGYRPIMFLWGIPPLDSWTSTSQYHARVFG